MSSADPMLIKIVRRWVYRYIVLRGESFRRGKWFIIWQNPNFTYGTFETARRARTKSFQRSVKIEERCPFAVLSRRSHSSKPPSNFDFGG